MTEVSLALDVAATELYDRSFKKYVFEGESKTKDYKVIRSSEELIDYYEGLIEQFPIVSIEDPLDEEDWDGWELLTTRLGLHTQLVGDDLFVTNTKRLKKGIEKEVANAILIKVNQIGTLTEALDTVEMAQKAGYRTIVSHRSGETADTLIADLAVAVGAGQIKTGAPCRSERVEKYNQLLRIEERLGDVAEYQNPFQIKCLRNQPYCAKLIMVLSTGGVCNGYFKNCSYDFICNRLYRIDSHCTDAGR